jgi:hypothetical protein
MIKTMLKGVAIAVIVADLAGCGNLKLGPKHETMHIEDPFGTLYPRGTDYFKGESKEQFKEQQINDFLQALNSRKNVHVTDCKNLKDRKLLCKSLGNYSKKHTVYMVESGEDWLGPEKQYFVVEHKGGKVRSFQSYSDKDWNHPVLSINKPRTGSLSYFQLKKIEEGLESFIQSD